MNREPVAWISKHRETGVEILDRVKIQSYPVAGLYEYTPLYSGEEESQALDAEMYGSREKFDDRRLPNGSVIDLPGLPSILLIVVGIGALAACALYALRFLAESMF